MVARDRYGGASARSAAGTSRTVVHIALSPADVDPWHPSGRPGTLHGLRARTGASAPAQRGGVRAVVVTEALRSRSEAPGPEPGSCPAAGDRPRACCRRTNRRSARAGCSGAQTRSRSGGTASRRDLPASRPVPFGGGTAAPRALRARELCRHRRSAPSGSVRGRTRRAHRTRPGGDSSLPRRFRPNRALRCAPPCEGRRRRRDAFGRRGGEQPSDAGPRAGSGGPDGSSEPWAPETTSGSTRAGEGTDRHQLVPDQPPGRRRARDGRLRSGGVDWEGIGSRGSEPDRSAPVRCTAIPCSRAAGRTADVRATAQSGRGTPRGAWWNVRVGWGPGQTLKPGRSSGEELRKRITAFRGKMGPGTPRTLASRDAANR